MTTAKILNFKIGESKNETRQKNEIQNQPISHEAEKTNAGGIESVHPCGICGDVVFWHDRYGGGPHCHRCRDWPSQSVVARIVAADVENGRWLTLWPRNESEVAQQAPNASCMHSRSRKRVVWPAAERDGRLVVDLDRWQEAEEFDECLACGKWFSVLEFQEFQNSQKGI